MSANRRNINEAGKQFDIYFGRELLFSELIKAIELIIDRYDPATHEIHL
jgi:hypothetical protein